MARALSAEDVKQSGRTTGQAERLRTVTRHRLCLAIVLLLLDIAWLLTAIVAWVAILFTGEYPKGLRQFGVGMMRWTLRVETYVLLMRDEYPPFSLQP